PLLIMELPPYKMPLLKVVVRHMWDRSKLFLRRAGTVILGINILLWFLATYPRAEGARSQSGVRSQAARPTGQHSVAGSPEQKAAVENEAAGERLRQSFAGRLGRFIEPAIAPLGF